MQKANPNSKEASADDVSSEAAEHVLHPTAESWASGSVHRHSWSILRFPAQDPEHLWILPGASAQDHEYLWTLPETPVQDHEYLWTLPEAPCKILSIYEHCLKPQRRTLSIYEHCLEPYAGSWISMNTAWIPREGSSEYLWRLPGAPEKDHEYLSMNTAWEVPRKIKVSLVPRERLQVVSF